MLFLERNVYFSKKISALKIKYGIIVVMCLLSICCHAQDGFLILNQDERIDALIGKQREIHAKDSTIDGFRVQIFMESGNDAVKHAENVKMAFIEKYPSVPVYLIFGQPYYRLRVGDFRTRIEAEKFYYEIKNIYKNAFVTGDRINLPYNVLCGNKDEMINFDDGKVSGEDNNIVIPDDIYYEE